MRAVLATPVRIGVVFSFLALAGSALAQAPVDDLTRPAQRANTADPAQPDPTMVLYNELQQLRAEVLRLTGQVEELGYEVQRLQAAQANDYANLDARMLDLSQRISAGGSAAPASPGSTAPNSGAPTVVIGAGAQPQMDDEAAAQLYTGSLDKLRAGDRAAAIAGFSELISTWPNDPLVADSYYWIGQTHWVAAEYESAREAFASLVNSFPGHRKYSESLFRLGQVYMRLGDTAQARNYLQQAVQTGSAISMQAEQVLSQMEQAGN